jgi:hypothetical protein
MCLSGRGTLTTGLMNSHLRPRALAGWGAPPSSMHTQVDPACEAHALKKTC